MGKRRKDADSRRFFDEFLRVKIPRLRAMGVVQLDAPHASIQVGDRQKLIGLAHIRFRNGGSWSYFCCPRCARRCNRMWLIEDRPLCAKCCNGLNIRHRTKWGFGRRERLKAKDKVLDELVAKLEATTPLRFSPPPKHWRGKARLVSNSRALTMRMRRAMIVCRLNQLASQQAGENGQGIAHAFQPLANAIQAIPAIKPVWQARTSEHLEQALDNAQTATFAALGSDDPQQRLAAARIFLRSKEARRSGW
jgi:hypothetical protein